MEQAEGLVEERHSVEWKVNAKGHVSGACKCYGSSPDEALKRASKLLFLMQQVISEKNRGGGLSGD